MNDSVPYVGIELLWQLKTTFLEQINVDTIPDSPFKAILIWCFKFDQIAKFEILHLASCIPKETVVTI